MYINAWKIGYLVPTCTCACITYTCTVYIVHQMTHLSLLVYIIFCRFSNTMPRIKSLITKYGDNLDMELQQRAVEYTAIFSKHDEMRLTCPLPLFLSPPPSSPFPSPSAYTLLTHIQTRTYRAGLLERMPVMSTKASSTVEGSLIQNGEPAAPSAESTPQIPLQVSLVMIILCSCQCVIKDFPHSSQISHWLLYGNQSCHCLLYNVLLSSVVISSTFEKIMATRLYALEPLITCRSRIVKY